MRAAIAIDGLIPLRPQPRNGRPFRVDFSNRSDQYWYNERLNHRHGGTPMFFEWKCPFGIRGQPQLIDGVWYWVKTEHEPSEAVTCKSIP